MIDPVTIFPAGGCRQPAGYRGGPLGVLFTLLLATAAAAQNAAPDAVPKLNLPDGDFVTGNLIDSDQPRVLRWQGDGFVSPLEFAVDNVNSVHFPSAQERPVPQGDYCFELSGGDQLFGKLTGLSATTAYLEVPRFGALQVARSRIQRIRRWSNGADLVYFGPNGLDEWQSSSPAGSWQDSAGHLVTERDGASIHKDFELPAQSAIEIELSWSSTPNFILALGVEGGDLVRGGNQAFRFEVWKNQLVALRETADEADVALVQHLVEMPGRMHVTAYLDQQQHRMFVASSAGAKLADLRVPGGRAGIFPGIHLKNLRGDVRLESLRISRWNGEAPRDVQEDTSRLHRADGSIVYGELTSFDSAAAQFVLAGDDGETRVAADDVGSIVLPGKANPAQSIRAVLRDGTRLSGQLNGVQAGRVSLTSPGIDAPLGIPILELDSLLSLDARPPDPQPDGRPGRLELAGARLGGVLRPGKRTADASGLVWQPHGSATASLLVPRIAGQIVYRDPPPLQPRVRPQPVNRGGIVNQGLLPAILQGIAASAPPANVPTTRAMHLRTGDTIPCEVIAIDERGVTFKSEMTDATFVPHDKIKAVELSNVKSPVKLDKTKENRLLTLPRMQRNSPPTHLIRSINGDFLRARIESLDETSLTVEVRLESRRLTRSQIAEIIWLHGDELGDTSDPSRQQANLPTHVQALRRNGTRLTFQPELCDGRQLAGASELLGRCHVELADVNILLIGKQVDDSAATLAYGRWRLHHAIDPKFVSADGAAARPAGTESDLVGKPAPDFTLDLLDGKPYQLSRRKGKVVVLDFWATWCGPCIQAMPRVDAVVREFKEGEVELIAVNLQEAPARIKSTLERLKLDPIVALDIDGVVASRYAATAIPQTVIIDRDGNVARLFVGGGSDFASQFRTALQSVVGGEAPPNME